MSNMPDLLKENTKLVHALSTAVAMNERALIDSAASRLVLHNNVMLAALHEESVQEPVEEVGRELA